MKVNYKNGNSLDTSYFLIDGSDEKIKVKASQVMPLPAQMRIRAGREDEVFAPEDMAEKMEDEFDSIDEFKEYAKKVTSKNKITARKLKNEKKRARKKRKSSKKVNKKKKVKASKYDGWSIDESELPSDINKRQDVNRAIDEDEAKDGDVDTVPNPRVKKYYNRLPSRSIGTDRTESIDRESSLKKKLKTQASKIEELKKRLDEKDGEVKQEKQKQARKEKAEKLDQVLEVMAKQGQIDLENEQERENAIKKYSDMDNKSLDLVLEMLEKENSQGQERTASKKTGNIPGNFASRKNAKRKNNVETMSDLWANSTKPKK